MQQIYTPGYEGLNINQFFAILQSYDIDKLIDVRQLALSRKKGFSKTSLNSASIQKNIQYLHFKELGCPKHIRTAYSINKNWGFYTENYLLHLDIQTDALVNLANIASESRCVLLCYESDVNTCHRLYIANYLVQNHDFLTSHLTKQDLQMQAVAAD